MLLEILLAYLLRVDQFLNVRVVVDNKDVVEIANLPELLVGGGFLEDEVLIGVLGFHLRKVSLC